MQYFSNLQVLRGVAALMVALYHSLDQGYVGSLFSAGARGVDIFFVISGFVVYFTALRAPSVANFLLMRLLRVVPLYWCACAALAMVYILVPQMLRTTNITFGSFLKSIFFIPHWSSAFPDQLWPILVPGWSLNYEMFFYALTAIGLLVAGRALFAFLIVGLCGLVLLGAFVETTSPYLLTYTSPLLLQFGAGIVLAKLAQLNALRGRLLSITGLPLGALLILADGNLHFVQVPTLLAVLLGTPLVVAGALSLEYNGFASTSRLWRLLGDASYSIYLSHLFTLGVLRSAWSRGLAMIGAGSCEMTCASTYGVAATVVCAVVGVIVFRSVEKPLLSVGRRWINQERRPVAT